MVAPGSVGIGARCFLPGASTTPPLRPLLPFRGAAAAGCAFETFEAFVVPPAICPASATARCSSVSAVADRDASALDWPVAAGSVSLLRFAMQALLAAPSGNE